MKVEYNHTHEQRQRREDHHCAEKQRYLRHTHTRELIVIGSNVGHGSAGLVHTLVA